MGFRVLGIRVQGLTFRVRFGGSAFKVQFLGARFRVPGSGFTRTPQEPLNRALMVLNSGYLGYDRG